MPNASSWSPAASPSAPFEFESPTLLLGVTLAKQVAVGLCDLESGRSLTVKIDLGESAVLDSYIREDDLVLTGEETPEAPVRTQAYIRGLTEDSACELILSRQTSLLDHAAPIEIKLTAGEFYRLAAGHLVEAKSNQEPGEEVALAAYLDDETACCVLVYPGDADEIFVEPSHLTIRSFTQSLEKGVIRRIRIRLFFLPIAQLEATLGGKLSEFCQSELPLTT
ncbi:hypothetical protein [Blastopirellula marina]|uniref:hypothetical protein n=1 Tax=Blastopirellula marina TaxID=124 RepID=UPI0011B03016|nr:hypothetical protein [Blastopirellula marina]